MSATLHPGPLRSGRGARRLLLSYGVTLFALVTVNFVLPRAAPGDPVTSAVSRSVDAAPTGTAEDLRRYYGLHRSLPEQYLRYLGDLSTGDLGTSIRYRAPVSKLILERLPWTLLLAGLAMALATVVGVVAGVHSGWHRGRASDRGLLVVFMGIRNFPPFFLGSLLLLVFGVWLGWAPLGGARTAFGDPGGALPAVADVGRHLALPLAVLTIQLAPITYLWMRSSMVAEAGGEYMVVGRAKGLADRRLKYSYAARNSILPVISLAGMQIGLLVTGTIFIERLFSYPGTGTLITEAATARDYPLLQGCALIVTVGVLTANFLADLVVTRLDPRMAP